MNIIAGHAVAMPSPLRCGKLRTKKNGRAWGDARPIFVVDPKDLEPDHLR
jgi:hypothetical protein